MALGVPDSQRKVAAKPRRRSAEKRHPTLAQVATLAHVRPAGADLLPSRALHTGPHHRQSLFSPERPSEWRSAPQEQQDYHRDGQTRDADGVAEYSR